MAPGERLPVPQNRTHHQPHTTMHHNSLLVMLPMLAVKEKKTPSLNPLYLSIVGISSMKKSTIKMETHPNILKSPKQNVSRKSEGTTALMFKKR